MAGMKILNVAEKNDAAKNIAEVLTRGRYTRNKTLVVGLITFHRL